MTFRKLIIIVIFSITPFFCSGQKIMIDSCGIDSNPILNYYEIIFLDSALLRPYKVGKTVFDPKDGFDFNNKKIAFFSCSINEITNGVLTKREFFSKFKSKIRGHAGRGIVIFNEKERNDANGIDAVVIIDCPYDMISNEELINNINEKCK